jgi:predicted dehydrogenase
MNKLTVALVGHGYWGPNLLRNLTAHPSIEVKWVVDLLEKNLERAKKNAPQVKVTTKLADALNDKAVDFVVVAVPTRFHFAVAQEALQAGKHVLVEKPLTSTTDEAKALQKLAKKMKRHVFVDHPYIFSPPIQYLKESLQKKELGELYYIESRRLNLGLIQSDINVIDDLSPHDFSILDYLLDGQVPTSVDVQGSIHTKSGQVERALLSLHYPSNVTASIHLSWLSPLKVRELFCVGSKKMIVIDDTSSSEKLKIYDKSVSIESNEYTPFAPFYRSGDVLAPQLPNGEPLAQMIDACYQKIAKNVSAPNEIDAAIRVVSLIELAQESLRKYREKIYGA